MCEGGLGVLMRDVGLARGAPQPESLPAMLDAATKTVADIKRYATSAMLTPTASPRFRSSASQARASEAITGGAQGGSTGAASTIAPSEGGGDCDADDGTDGAPKLHACKNCQRAKTACNDQRPCARCVRLGAACDGDMRAVKRACAACKKSKVKCDLDDRHPDPCTRCARLCAPCIPHVPNKKKARLGKGGDDDDDEVPGAVAFGGFGMSPKLAGVTLGSLPHLMPDGQYGHAVVGGVNSQFGQAVVGGGGGASAAAMATAMSMASAMASGMLPRLMQQTSQDSCSSASGDAMGGVAEPLRSPLATAGEWAALRSCGSASGELEPLRASLAMSSMSDGFVADVLRCSDVAAALGVTASGTMPAVSVTSGMRCEFPGSVTSGFALPGMPDAAPFAALSAAALSDAAYASGVPGAGAGVLAELPPVIMGLPQPRVHPPASFALPQLQLVPKDVWTQCLGSLGSSSAPPSAVSQVPALGRNISGLSISGLSDGGMSLGSVSLPSASQLPPILDAAAVPAPAPTVPRSEANATSQPLAPAEGRRTGAVARKDHSGTS